MEMGCVMAEGLGWPPGAVFVFRPPLVVQLGSEDDCGQMGDEAGKCGRTN